MQPVRMLPLTRKGASMSNRRVIVLSLMGLSAVALPGCMTKPLQPVRADGTYCYAYGRAYRQLFTCTNKPVPPASVEADAKRFQPDAAALTVYVVRRRWLDSVDAVPLTVDGHETTMTVPLSLVRLQLRPGRHELSVSWDSRFAGLRVEGNAGDVQFVELNGTQWAWSTHYRLEQVAAEDGQVQAIRSKLIADVAALR